ncbi:hypothetical protein ATANTOWER_029205 [Ataeniobius toweri]|uniref:Uncharacterized protein n=1 Tax=Ataeniobius toweri TaxID=208326 RepID=A0ABU7AJG6_9TELE|nr:hypothetical protein [Ataeniobius toweri]
MFFRESQTTNFTRLKKVLQRNPAWINDSTTQQLVNHTWSISNLELTDEGVIIWVKILHRLIRRTIRCNWIHPDRGVPEWHCDWACRPLVQFKGHGYWEPEVIHKAPSRVVSCPAWFPRWEFWGKYQLNCDENVSTKPDASQHTSNHTDWGLVIPEGGSNTTAQNRTRLPDTPRPKNTLSTRNRTNYPLGFRNREALQECINTKLRHLPSCFWNIFTQCRTQNYLPLAPLYTHPVYLSFITSWSKTIWTD